MLKFPGIVHNDPDGLWIEFPDLPGCVTQGSTPEELVLMAEDALSLYLSVLDEDNADIPEPSRLEGEGIIYINVLPEVALPIMLRKIRQEKKLTQSEVANRIKKPYQSYQRLEHPGKFNITIKTLEKVARALGKRVEINLI